ncbi:MAG: hypothetical protein IJX39_08845 [Clostridia bacterium]|nr:hypothetical protein [Clostridia bacterium]
MTQGNAKSIIADLKNPAYNNTQRIGAIEVAARSRIAVPRPYLYDAIKFLLEVISNEHR